MSRSIWILRCPETTCDGGHARSSSIRVKNLWDNSRSFDINLNWWAEDARWNSCFGHTMPIREWSISDGEETFTFADLWENDWLPPLHQLKERDDT